MGASCLRLWWYGAGRKGEPDVQAKLAVLRLDRWLLTVVVTEGAG